MPPFLHHRRRARLPTALGAAAVSRHHPSINFPVVFRFSGAGAQSRLPLVPPLSKVDSFIRQQLCDLPNQTPFVNSLHSAQSLQGVDGLVHWRLEKIKQVMLDLLKEGPESEEAINIKLAGQVAQLLEEMLDFLVISLKAEDIKIVTAVILLIDNFLDFLQIILKDGNIKQSYDEEMYPVFSKLVDETLRAHCQERRLLDPCEKEEQVVGMEENVKRLIRELILDEEKKCLSIAAVVGMGGIGKSTLAREIYHHPSVLARFDCRAWVLVSSKSTPEETIMKLIFQLLSSEQETQMLHEQIYTLAHDARIIYQKSLQRMLYKLLKGKTYFIVLDDMWDKEHWEHLRKAFPNEQGKASRLLLTSRARNITENAQYIHEMKILDPNKSWQLFLKTVFTSDHEYDHMKCPKHLEKIGREILKKCNGLPLAIKVVGSQLSIKRQSESVWESFLESVDLSAISEALELSYVKLPPQLKSCFSCLGFFKEGTTIRVEKLVQVWNAGGFVSQEGEEKKQTNEEIGRRYLDELISQSMVQVKDMTRDNRVKNCHMNDNLHRLSITKAEEKIRFEVLKKDGNYRPSHKPRHRAICCSREKFNYSTNQDIHLRSLFFHGGGNFVTSPSYWESFELLKILDLEGFGLKSLPEMIGTVTTLRYLGLRNNFIQELPRLLGDLEKLEVLDIALNFMMEVPDIQEMDSLRHLYMSDIICKEPLRIDALKHLQTLTYISVDNWIYNFWGLQKMKSLRKLGIEELDGTSDISRLFASLAKLKNLDCLILRGFRFRSMPSLDKLGILRRLTQLKLDGLLTKLPSANNFPPNIAYLTLVNSSLDEDPMPELGKLSNLFGLKLRNAFTGEQMVISRCKFAKLQVLCIGEFCHLRNLQVGEGAMPMLKRLEISSCPYLETLPKTIGLMTNLKELKMVTTKKIATKIRELGLISEIGDVDIQP
ncbi:hypothetical protein C2S51_032386 [Perilla frutescens var. frutescens]|nr:hypothetical protein C2S51_032386 [Perilla frutescens var. frutescens]